MKFVTTLRRMSEEEFKEEEHPRADDGKFTSKGGGVSKKSQVSKDKKPSNADRIENVKDTYYIKGMLKAGVEPNEMDLQLAELDKKKDELRDIKTKRTFKYTFGGDNQELELTGTPEFEKALIEYDKLSGEVKKKEEDEYRKSYGWKEGDPFRWTPHNDDPDTADTSGDYGSDYTYKHLTEEESDVIMRRWWNDSMTRKEREYKYDYNFAENIPYVNEYGNTPQELEKTMGHWDGTAEVSDYFFFTDDKTGEQFTGKGMTQEEIKKRAKHGLGSSTTIHPDGSETEKIVYDRPLNYKKFHSDRKSASNFGESGSRTDKLWDDLDDDERRVIKSDYKFDGEFYIGWQEEQEKLFYDWKSRQGNTGGDKVNGKHNELYSEYGISEKTDFLNNVTLTDDDRLDYAYKMYKDEYIEKHSDEELIDVIKKRDDRWALRDKKRGIMKKISGQTYFQQDPIERQKYVGVLFNGLNAYDKDMLAGDAFDYEAPNNPTEDDELRWEDLTDDEHMDIRKVVENEADEDSPIYDIEETFGRLQPKKAIGFDYEKGIPEPQNVDILRNWANRMHPIAYVGGIDKETKEVIIPQYPKAKQRTVKEHENQIKQLNSTLKKETEKHKPTDKEYWGWEENVITHDVEEFREYVRKNESKLNLDLHMYKSMWDKDDWLYGTHLPKNEKEWRKHFINRALGVGDSHVASKVNQLRHFTSLIKQNPKLEEKYQHILDKTDKLNHDNYDLFLKTPEFYRGTRTFELDHYLENKNTGDMWDWSEKHYPFTALGMDKSTAQSPSEQRIDWEMKDGELSGGKVVITYEGDSVRELGVPVQYNTQSTVNNQGADASEIIGMPYNMVAYAEREVRVNPNSKIPKIKEINFGINMGKYKDQKILPVRQRKMLLKKYLPLVGGDKSKIKFYKFVERGEAYAVEEFREEEHPREQDGKFAKKGSGSSNGQVVLHKTTHDFLKKWLSDVSMSNTQIFGSIMGKGGLDITYTHKNPDYDEDLPESDDNPKKYTVDSPINNTYKLAKVLGIGIKSKKSQKEWSDSNNEFLKLIDTNPDLNKVFKEYKGEVDGQNKMLQKKYKESKVFYRGTSVDELDAIFGFGEGSYSDTEYDVNHISKWRSRYTFKSLSMNHDETLKMYNAGMMIHFNADTVRKAGRLMDYKAEPTQYLHADVDSSIDQTKIENANTDNPAFLIDEEEVRIDNSKMEGVKIDKIDIYLRGGSRPDGSSNTFDVINKLVSRFGITNNLPKWYELNRMELLGKDQLLDGKKDDKNFERVFAKDPKGVNYVKSIIDRKTGKTYPEIPFKYDKDKLNDHMRNMRTEAKKDMASTIQKELMENKLFRSKVGDVMVKW